MVLMVIRVEMFDMDGIVGMVGLGGHGMVYRVIMDIKFIKQSQPNNT